MVGFVMVVVFVAPMLALLWAGASSQKERKARVRDFEVGQAVREPRAPQRPDESALGDQLFDPEHTAPFRRAGALLASRRADGTLHHDDRGRSAVDDVGDGGGFDGGSIGD